MTDIANVPIEQIELDSDNPRVKHFKEMHGGVLSEDKMLMALGAAAANEGSTDPKDLYERLKNAIKSSGGIIQPVLLKSLGEDGDRFLCIEGNTRVAIYRELYEESSQDPKRQELWANIPAIVSDSMSEQEAHKIRLQIHLVGVREWDPYAKSKYLYELSKNGNLSMQELVAYCGGSKRDVQEAIRAYEDMEQFYRPILEDDIDFDPSRFSAFVELQRGGVKPALYKAGYNESDFSKWVHSRHIFPLYTVRKLPAILGDEKATQVFLAEGARKAALSLEASNVDSGLKDYGISQLALALLQKLETLPYEEAAEIANGVQQDIHHDLQDLSECLVDLLKSATPAQGEER